MECIVFSLKLCSSSWKWWPHQTHHNPPSHSLETSGSSCLIHTQMPILDPNLSEISLLLSISPASAHRFLSRPFGQCWPRPSFAVLQTMVHTASRLVRIKIWSLLISPSAFSTPTYRSPCTHAALGSCPSLYLASSVWPQRPLSDLWPLRPHFSPLRLSQQIMEPATQSPCHSQCLKWWLAHGRGSKYLLNIKWINSENWWVSLIFIFCKFKKTDGEPNSVDQNQVWPSFTSFFR